MSEQRPTERDAPEMPGPWDDERYRRLVNYLRGTLPGGHAVADLDGLLAARESAALTEVADWLDRNRITAIPAVGLRERADRIVRELRVVPPAMTRDAD